MSVKLQTAVKDRLNREVQLELKFHEVDNLSFLEGPSRSSFPVSKQGE